MRQMLWLLALVTLLAAPGSAARAETITVTLQRGLDGGDGVEDLLLYAPASVANLNYGAFPSLSTGINRWNEQYTSLIRFHLGFIPTAARVTQASLWLHNTSTEWPARDLQLDVCSVAPANADWAEGTGNGTHGEVHGATCWNARRLGVAKWAGRPGLRQGGVDTVEPPLGSVRVGKGQGGWIELPLRAEAVQAWIEQPTRNAGLCLLAPTARQAGDMVSVHSSEYAADSSLRPKLTLQLEMDAATAAAYRQARARLSLAQLAARLAPLREAVATAGSPPRAAAALTQSEWWLGLLREEVSTDGVPDEAALQRTLAGARALRQRVESLPGELTLARAAAANERRGLATDFALGVTDGMTNVLRPTELFQGTFPHHVEVELARNEFEPAQIVLVPVDRDLIGATWSVSALSAPGGAVIPAADVSVSVMGYLKSRKAAIPTPVQWWPSPILDFMKSVDVRRGEVQPLWLCVRAREHTPAGLYTGTLTVRGQDVQPKSIELRVRVFDFTVPKEQHLRTVWGNSDACYRPLYGDRYDQAMARRIFDFFLEHRLAVNDLYAAQAAGKPIGEGFYSECIGLSALSDPNELRRLWEAGSRWWNLGYLHPVFAERAGLSLDEYVPKFIEMMRESLKVAEAAGWPRENLGIYFFDETRDFETLNRAASQVKAAFPDIALMTTGYDRSYGVKNGPIDQSIDIWCPLTPRFAEDQKLIDAGRKLGKRAWWYVCCVPKGGGDLNFFSQLPAVRSRLLMGAATWKYQPDGFLYYRVPGWAHYKKPIDSGPLTDWQPYFLPGPDGDGELICPGPDGPLSTLQFENIRDGIEDYEYYWLLRERVEQARERGLDVSAAAGLLSVSPSLLTSLTTYSEEPARLRAERRRIADAIVALEKQLRP